MRISDWSSDVCSSDLQEIARAWLLGVERNGLFERLERRGGQRVAPVDIGADLAQRRPQAGIARGQRARFFIGGDRARIVGAVEAQIGRASCRERVCQSV